MKTSHFLFFSLLAFLVIGCNAPGASSPTAVPTPLSPTPEPTESSVDLAEWLVTLDDSTILFQHTYEPTFFRPETLYDFGRVPFFTLYAGGTVVFVDEGQSFDQQQVMAAELSPEETAALFAALSALDFERLENHTDMCRTLADGTTECIADDSFTIFRATLPEQGDWDVRIYSEFSENVDLLRDLKAFTTGYTHPNAVPFVPETGMLFVRPIGEPTDVQALAWPLDEAMLRDLGFNDFDLGVLVLKGEDLSAFLRSVPRNTGDSFTTIEDQHYGLYFVPWLPGTDYSAAVAEAFPAIEETSGPETPSAYPTLAGENCPAFDFPAPGILRLAYLMDGDVWLWDDGFEPISFTGDGSGQQVVLTPSGNRVVYIRQLPGQPDSLWAAAPDQSEILELTASAAFSGPLSIASFSSDEAMVAFVHEPSPGLGELWAANMDGTGARRLVSSEDLMTIVAEPLAEAAVPAGVTWIPNTYTLTYDARPTFADGIYIYVQQQVWVVDALTGAQAEWFPVGQGGAVSYSPDGATMLLVTPDSIAWMNVEEGILNVPDIDYRQMGMGEFYVQPPLIWEGGSRSFLVAVPEGEADPHAESRVNIYRVPVDGSAPEMLAGFDGFFPSFEFAPTGDKIAFWRSLEPQSNTNELHIAMIDGSEHIIYDVATGLQFQGWASDGQHFLFGSWQSNAGWVGNACSPDAPVVIDAGFLPWETRWFDLTRFLFERTDPDNNQFELYIGDWSGASQIRLNTGAPFSYDIHVIYE